jgi:hypothetical protein
MPCNTSRPGSSAFRPRSGSRRQRREEDDDSTIECETREIWPPATAATFRRDGDICFCVRPAGRPCAHVRQDCIFGCPFPIGHDDLYVVGAVFKLEIRYVLRTFVPRQRTSVDLGPQCAGGTRRLVSASC